MFGREEVKTVMQGAASRESRRLLRVRTAGNICHGHVKRVQWCDAFNQPFDSWDMSLLAGSRQPSIDKMRAGGHLDQNVKIAQQRQGAPFQDAHQHPRICRWHVDHPMGLGRHHDLHCRAALRFVISDVWNSVWLFAEFVAICFLYVCRLFFLRLRCEYVDCVFPFVRTPYFLFAQ